MKLFIAFTLLLFTCQLEAQTVMPRASYKLVSGKSYVQSKNYYLLTLFQENAAARKLLENDKLLSAIAKTKHDTLIMALKDCGSNLTCYTARLKFSKEEISAIGSRLSQLYSPTNALGALVHDHLQPSGTYFLYQEEKPADMLVKAWEQDANAVNFAIGVYAEGKKPNYPNVDSISYRLTDAGFTATVYTATYEIAKSTESSHLFFISPLTAALRFLEINERNNAADFEPMTAKENKSAFDRIPKINFSKYPYSIILVPGAGPEEPEVALSGEGMLRSRIAAIQYKAGMAPFIMVSGGKVHPYKTKYCEALEMKRFLMETLDIPENAILIDPHARHTTTNLRNAARIVFRYGLPFEKAMLTSTSRAQSLSIATSLADRCKKELNIVPFRVGKRLSETEVETFPLMAALQIDPDEPMDP